MNLLRITKEKMSTPVLSYDYNDDTMDDTRESGRFLTPEYRTGSVDVLQDSTRIRKYLSISDLLNRSMENYSSCFPLIDTTTYIQNAQRATSSPTPDDWDNVSLYFADPMRHRSDTYKPSPMCLRRVKDGYTASSLPSLGSRTSSVSGQNVPEHVESPKKKQGEDSNNEVDDGVFDIKHLLRTPQLSRKPSIGKDILIHNQLYISRRKSMPLALHSMHAVETEDSPCAWIGCFIKYMVISRKLNLSLVRSGVFMEEVQSESKLRLMAQLSLLPGGGQQKTIRIKRTPDSSEHVSLGKYTASELRKMEVGVKLYFQKGWFKKSKRIQEWTIPLAKIDLLEEQVAWKKIQ